MTSLLTEKFSEEKQSKTFPLMRSHGGLPTRVNKRNSPVDFLECFTLKLECFALFVPQEKLRGGLGRGHAAIDLTYYLFIIIFISLGRIPKQANDCVLVFQSTLA